MESVLEYETLKILWDFAIRIQSFNLGQKTIYCKNYEKEENNLSAHKPHRSSYQKEPGKETGRTGDPKKK